jgi:hypothetical protein
MSPLKRPKYAKIKLTDIPEEVSNEYKLRQLATPDGWVYVKVTRAMYGLPQAGSIETKYGAKQQYAEYDTSAPVGKDEQKHVQQVTGKFNWYARGVDGTLLTPISALSAQQAKPTQSTMKRVKQFLDYAATHEPAVTTYRASDMVLAIHMRNEILTPYDVVLNLRKKLAEQ